MAGTVSPRVYLVGYTHMEIPEVVRYLKDTDQSEFLNEITQARDEGISTGEILCSLYAKLCYKSLKVGKNANVTKVRSVQSNLENCHDVSHGSVFEHFQLNFLVSDCSRVFTHEQVRHRVGWAYSQTSGRYCRLDKIDLVWDPVLDPVKGLFLKCVRNIEDTVYLAECKLGLRKPNPDAPTAMDDACLVVRDEGRVERAEQIRWVPDDTFDFEKRKKITSAIRRIAPNGQSNEIGMSCNIRALRQVVQLRTQRFAEREIRDVYNQVYNLVREWFPGIFYKAKTRSHDGLLEVYGMRTQPFEIEPGDPRALEHWSPESLKSEIERRGS